MNEKKLKQMIDFSKKYMNNTRLYTLQGICRTRGTYPKCTDYIVINVIVSPEDSSDVSYAIPWEEFVQTYNKVG